MSDIDFPTYLAGQLKQHPRIVLASARVPVSLLGDGAPDGAGIDRDGAALVDIVIEAGVVASVRASEAAAAEPDASAIRLKGRHVWPLLVDAHAHLDKAHILGRTPESGGTHPGARAATTADRLAHWTRDDILRRMEFGLATADAHGVAAIRTHLDSHEGQAETGLVANSSG